jgi:hypothetical protein
MELSKVKLLFETGSLTSATAHESLLTSKAGKRQWVLSLSIKNHSEVNLSLKGGKEDRVFNSLDAVFNTAYEIGFSKVLISVAR